MNPLDQALQAEAAAEATFNADSANLGTAQTALTTATANQGTAVSTAQAAVSAAQASVTADTAAWILALQNVVAAANAQIAVLQAA